MKKLLTLLSITLIIIFTTFMFSCPTSANVAGQCSNCHTMHYSQNGVSTMYEAGGPFPVLLTGSCVGCHTTPVASPQDPYANSTPYVKSTTSGGLNDNRCIAGGFFPHDTMGMGNNNDNHHGMGNLSDPAGKTTGTFYTQGATGLGCAGINGCHGNETDLSDMDAIKGGHHATSQTYRMLYVNGVQVSGDPAIDYEKAIINDPSLVVQTSGVSQNVNIYSAGGVTVNATISELCGKCHGDFHGANGTPANGTTNAGGEWIRHPSDYDLPDTWIMGADTYDFDGDDAKQNPFGYTNAVYVQGGMQVTCLSCHRAHGTNNADLLRWVYVGAGSAQKAGQPAGSQTDFGCLGCHDAQR